MTTPNPGPVTIACPVCRESLPVPSDVIGRDDQRQTVDVRMDAEPLRKHLTLECPGKPPATSSTALAVPQPAPAFTDADLRGRVDRFLLSGAFIAPGTRACQGCGVAMGTCLNGTEQTTRPCCAMCAEGATHPMPGADASCAEWGAENGATS